MLILLIQLFEPEIYHEIKDNKDLFLVKSEDSNKEENRIKIEKIMELQKIHHLPK